MTHTSGDGNTERRVQLGYIDDVPESLLDPAVPGSDLDDLLSYAHKDFPPSKNTATLPASGWRMISSTTSGPSLTENQAWVAPGADGSWHQLNLVTLRRDGSKRIQTAPYTLRAFPCRSFRRKPLHLDWVDHHTTLTTTDLQDHQFDLKLTNTGPITWVNEADDKSTLDLRYPERSPGFTQLVVGIELPNIPASQSVILKGRLVETPPVGTYKVTAELVDLQLSTDSTAVVTVTP